MARYFDGVDDYISLPYNYGQPNTITISLWFRTTQASWDTLFGQTDALPPNNASAFISVFAIKDTGVLRAELWTGNVGEISTPFSVRDGQWHHAAIVGNVNIQMLYVDGQFIGSRSGTIQQSWWLYSFIGTGYDYTGRNFPNRGWHYFNGEIAEVRIYNRALSQDEIISEMYRRIPAKANLVGYYPLWEQSGTTVLDHSGNGRNGTIYGAIYVDDPPMLGGSMVTP